jgi:hypothetical protein
MDGAWQREFQHRMRHFENRRAPQLGDVSVSIKVRVVSGCFHREHSPRAYQIIDEQFARLSTDSFAFEEHESGPELLAYATLAAAGITLANNDSPNLRSLPKGVVNSCPSCKWTGTATSLPI